MRDGTLAGLAQAWRLLFSRTELWWPGCLGDALWFVWTVGWLKALWVAAGSGGVGWVLAGWLLTLVVWAAWDAARWFAADRVLRGDAADLRVWLAGLRHRGAAWLAGTVAVGVGQTVLALASAVVILHLLSGGEWRRLLHPGHGVVDGWRSQGWLWLLGGIVTLAVIGAGRTMLGWAGDWWRVALLVERPRTRAAMAAAIEFAWRRRWGQTGRWLARQMIGLVVWLTPLGLAWLLTELFRVAGWRLPGVVTVVWLLTTAAGWSLARAWVTLADLVVWRRHGGLDARPSLAGRVVRSPRRRVPRVRDGGVRLASEPGDAPSGWCPTLASEPLES